MQTNHKIKDRQNKSKISLLKMLSKIIPVPFANWVYTRIIVKSPLRYIVNKIIKSNIPEKIQIDEGILFLYNKDVGVSGMLALDIFEPFETKLFRETLRPGMTVIDIGANIGYYTVIASKHVGKNGKIFAYEVEDTNYSYLDKNIKVNSINNVIAKKIAVSNKTGNSSFFLTDDNKGAHSFANNRHSKKSIIVNTDTIDNSIDTPIDIIKMDIEGAEILAIEGMVNTIKKNQKIILFTEFYPKAIKRLGRNPKDYLDKLSELGFKIHVINENDKTITPVNDFEIFIKSFPKFTEGFRNLYAIKE